MIRRLAALALLVAGTALHGQTPCAPGPALFHISGFQRDNPPTTDVVYIKLPNKPPLEFLRRISVIEKDGKPVNDKRYLPGEGEIRTDFVKQVGEPCVSKFYKRIDDLKTDDLFVESSLRGILKQLTESEPLDVRETIAPSQSGIQSLKPEIERSEGKTQPPPPLPQTAGEYSWKNRPFFFFVGMLATPLLILARSKWRQRFFRKAKMPFPVARRLLVNTKAAREATEKLVELQRPPTAKAIADAVVEGMQRGQAQADTLLQLLASLQFHPRFLTADLQQRLVTTAQPTADLLSQKEVDDLDARQRWDNVRREAERALHGVRDAVEGLDARSQLRVLLNEQFLATMYHYDDDALSAKNLGNATESGAPEKAISVFRRLRRGELLLSTYVIPVLPELEVASAAWLLRSLQVAVNELWTLLNLMGIQPDELVLLRQPPPDAEVKQISGALSTIRDRFPDVSRLLQQESLSGKAVCDFEEVGYSLNNKRQRRSVVYELALNKPPRETASKPEPVAPHEPPRRPAPVVTPARQETKPAEITILVSPPAPLPGTLETVPPEVASLRQLLDSGTLSALSREDVGRWTALIDNAATYRDRIWQLSQLCWTLFRKRDTVSAGVVRDALEKCGVFFKDAVIGEPADMQSDFDKEPHQKAMNLSLITEAEVKAHRVGAVVKQLVPFVEFDGKVQKGLVVVRSADFF